MDEEHTPPVTDPTEEIHVPEKKTSPWIYISIAAAIASVLYRVVVLNSLEQTSLLFIGIPLILSILIARSPSPTTTTGSIIKGITLCLLLFGILLFEGLICILLASPLFYLVGSVVGYSLPKKNAKRNKLNCTCITVIALMSLEGICDLLSFDRVESVSVSHEIQLTAEEAIQHLAHTPDFDLRNLPTFLKLGFPTPQEISGDGLAVGDTRVIHFAGGEGEPGDLTLEIVESSSRKIVFKIISDESHIDHWLGWKTFTWEAKPSPTGNTTITVTLDYIRKLDPAWYFKPVERYGVRKAGEYFIQNQFPDSMVISDE